MSRSAQTTTSGLVKRRPNTSPLSSPPAGGDLLMPSYLVKPSFPLSHSIPPSCTPDNHLCSFARMLSACARVQSELQCTNLQGRRTRRREVTACPRPTSSARAIATNLPPYPLSLSLTPAVRSCAHSATRPLSELPDRTPFLKQTARELSVLPVAALPEATAQTAAPPVIHGSSVRVGESCDAACKRLNHSGVSNVWP